MPISTSSFTDVKPLSFTSMTSSPILQQLHTPSADVACDSLDEPGRMCRESVQLCKTNLTLMGPLSWQGMLHMLQRKVLPKKPTVAQLLIQFAVFYRTCWLITIFTTAWLTPSHLIFQPKYLLFSHLSFTEQITIRSHMFSAIQTPCWHTNMRDKKARHWEITERLKYHS